MKKFKYEKYDYAFLYGLLTEEQRKEVQSILDRFIGYPNNEATRYAIEDALNAWIIENNIIENNINIASKLAINYE
jgi:LPS O-antigen subunit length determinant protein (WzzB/FepE family)